MKNLQLYLIFDSILNRVQKKFPDFPDISLEYCKQANLEHKKSARSYSHCLHYPNTICVANAIDDLPIRNYKGVIWHEHGHLISDYMRKNQPELFKELFDNVDEEEVANLIILKYFGIRIKFDNQSIEFID